MKKILMSAIVALGLVFAGSAAIAKPPAPVGPAAGMKIGVIDLHQIMTQSPKMKAIGEQLEAKFKPRQEQIVAAQKTLQANMTKLSRNASVMSSSEKEALQDKIISERTSLQSKEEQFQQDLNLAQNTAMRNFLKKLNTVLGQIAAKGHYAIILQKDSVPYATSSLDVTNQVLAAFDKG